MKLESLLSVSLRMHFIRRGIVGEFVLSGSILRWNERHELINGIMNTKGDVPLRVESSAGKTLIVFAFFSFLGLSLWFTPLPSKLRMF